MPTFQIFVLLKTRWIEEFNRKDLPILRMDSNVNFMVEWAIEAPSLQQWLETWVNGKPLFALNWEQATKIPVSRLGKAF